METTKIEWRLNFPGNMADPSIHNKNTLRTTENSGQKEFF